MLNNINEYLAADLEKTLGKNRFSVIEKVDPIAIKINKEDLLPLLKFLQSNVLYSFAVLIDIFAVDYPSNSKRFEVNYNLLSIKHNYRLNIKIDVAVDEDIPSVIKLYSTAGWFEREVWDMYGIKFKGNQDLRRILTDYGFEGHPLRKDFPLTGYKELTYDLEKHKVVYRDVKLAQEYRVFDFESPWEGTQYDIEKSLEESGNNAADNLVKAGKK